MPARELVFVIVGMLVMLAGQAAASPIESVMLHPFTPYKYTCSEHYEGELAYPGDALGSDCAILGESGTRKPDAVQNEDFYSWRKPVLAPFDGVVVAVHENPTTNDPGVFGNNPPGMIVFQRGDGVMVMFGHLRELAVKKGDTVTAGQYVARIGNNGMSSSPHVHAGAWKDGTPLQIRWDLRAMGKLVKEGWAEASGLAQAE